MEQKLQDIRQARVKGKALGDARAMELQMEHPQTFDRNMFDETTPEALSGGGGEAGLRRVVGGAKRRGRPKKMVGGAVSLNDQMGSDAGPCGGSNGRMVGGAKEMGKALGEQLKKLHGDKYASDFMEGMGLCACMSKKVRGGAGPRSAPPSGVEVGHALMSPAESGLPGQALGGQDVPPGGMAPIAYGNAPQAPASFKRNTVGAGRPAGAGMCGGAVSRKGREDEKLAMEVKGVKDKVSQVALLGRPGHGVYKGGAVAKMTTGGGRSARGQAIAKLMREKGMSLGEASKYLKENGSK